MPLYCVIVCATKYLAGVGLGLPYIHISYFKLVHGRGARIGIIDETGVVLDLSVTSKYAKRSAVF